MLPTEIGGIIQHNQSEWIAIRLAVELGVLQKDRKDKSWLATRLDMSVNSMVSDT
jgi:hypothetical protein